MSLPEQLQHSGRLDPLVWKITSVAVICLFLSQLDATVVSLPSEGPPLKVHFVVVEGGRKLREVIDENAITVTGEKVDECER
jgi:hypothetical protein